LEDHECGWGEVLDHVCKNDSFPLGLECGIEDELLGSRVLFVEVLGDVSRVGDVLVGGGIIDHRESVPRSSIRFGSRGLGT